MSFSVLPRRDVNPDMDELHERRGSGWSTMALPDSGLDVPLLDYLGVEIVDPANGVIELPVLELALNSMGALQGGAVATVCEAAAQVALRTATGEPLVRHRSARHVPRFRACRTAAHARRRPGHG